MFAPARTASAGVPVRRWSPLRRAHRPRPAAGMYGDVVDGERCGAAGGALDGLRDIVQLQIEEDRLAESANRFDRGAPMRDEQLEAHLEQADVTQQPGSEPLRRARIADVEGSADPVHRESLPPPSRT